MNRLLGIIKPAVRPALLEARKWRLRRQLNARLAKGERDYEFTREDVELHIRESFVRMPQLVMEATPHADLAKATISGRSILWPSQIDSKDLPWLYHEVFDAFETNPSSYDHPELDYKNRQWVIDAGAAEGYFSLFSLECSPAMVIAIEPLSLMKRALEQTLERHSRGQKAMVVTAALADKAGWSEFVVDLEHICDSKLHSPNGSELPAGPTSGSERVRITTIDELVADHALAADGLIKMDIEGFEMAALQGATATLKTHKPALAIAVYHDLHNAHQCADIIAAANPAYRIEFRGCYGYFDPPRPYMVFAT